MATEKGKILCSWSGGKDSCFALMKAIEEGYAPAALLNVLNEEGRISRSHGIPKEILQAQAEQARLPISLIESSWQDYEVKFTNALAQLVKEYHCTDAVFGDIDLQAHRDWEEKVCSTAGLTAVLPLWLQDRKQLVLQMLDAGIETMIVSCDETMGEKFLGRTLDKNVVAELEILGIDPCGENGEFHTLVLNCPLFKNPIAVSVVDKLKHESYWFCSVRLNKL
jgi:diphthine-ammonia ligase